MPEAVVAMAAAVASTAVVASMAGVASMAEAFVAAAGTSVAVARSPRGLILSRT